jgi:hypothetical protein
MSDSFEGGCQCGAVRYTVTAEPMWGGHCQCTNCQKFSGTGHASNYLVSLDAFDVTGEMSEFSLRFQSVAATQALNRSAGVSNPSVLRGRSFS